MSQNTLLMPKATAAWLVDNTSLTFDQIADFCRLHLLEVKAIADGEAGQNVMGLDPINSGQLSRDEVAKGENDPAHRLRIAESKVILAEKKRKGPRYTPVSRRQDRPNAILWLLRNHAELKDAQIMRLVGTTKSTILQLRERAHWNMNNLVPQDPVTLGLCSQIDLDFEVGRSAKNLPPSPVQPVTTLLPADQSVRGANEGEVPEKKVDLSQVFAKFSKKGEEGEQN